MSLVYIEWAEQLVELERVKALLQRAQAFESVDTADPDISRARKRVEAMIRRCQATLKREKAGAQ
jgi:hypothetical protein